MPALGQVPGFEKFEVAGAGYINARVNREEAARLLLDSRSRRSPVPPAAKRFWSSTPASIPTRRPISAICAMPFWAIRLSACFRLAGAHVDVQNYIDNTGVQVADVVVGFLYLEKKGKSEIEKLIAAAGPPPHSFDYYCWDLYAQRFAVV